MRTKIIFVVLFMLSFSVAHDTVINMIHSQDHVPTTSHSLYENIQSQECDMIDKMHAMFHFEALIDVSQSTFLDLPTLTIGSYHKLRYKSPYKDPSYKPPIA